MTPCHLCDAEAVALLSLPNGCACSDARVQALCPQHVVSCEPTAGPVGVEARYRPDVCDLLGL